jgi:GT2 family glycosyltransferase
MGVVTMPYTTAEQIALRDNDYRSVVAEIEQRTSLGWHEPTPRAAATGTRLSVVIPARNTAYSLPTVLDALAAQDTAGMVEVIVIDDASTDETPYIVREHPAVDVAFRLPRRAGGGVARNVGTHLAEADTVVYLDSDMVLPPHVLADFAARAHPDLVLVGFRHNIAYRDAGNLRAEVPDGEPDLDADHRVSWKPPADVPMFYSGQVYAERLSLRPLDATGEFTRLGGGAMFYDWDLPRMFVTALVAAPRQQVLEVGGFDSRFDAAGWGSEDTHLGAALIAAGCLVVPLRQARGWHIDPPDAAASWREKYVTAPERVALYRRLLEEPAPTGRADEFTRKAKALLETAQELR